MGSAQSPLASKEDPRYTRIGTRTANRPMSDFRLFAATMFFFSTAAEAASVAKPIIAWKAEADSKKAVDLLAKQDNAGLNKFSGPKLSSGDCFSLFKGMAVDVERKDGQLLCVRPTGGLDCYWAAEIAISQKPTEPETRKSPPTGGHRRGGFNHS